MHLSKSIQNYKIRQKIRYAFYITILFLSVGCLITDVNVKEDKTYIDFNHVVMYIYAYNKLPSNYVPKFQSYLLEDDDFTVYGTFRNYEKLLPLDAEYTEAYINAKTDNKGAQRFVYTTNIVYFTSDHYESFDIITESDIQTPYNTFLLFLLITIVGIPVFSVTVIQVSNVIEIKDLKNDFTDDFKQLKKGILFLGTSFKRKQTNSIDKTTSYKA